MRRHPLESRNSATFPCALVLHNQICLLRCLRNRGTTWYTLNLIVGISLSTFILGSTPLSPRSILSLWWLVGMTLLALGLLFFGGGLGRKDGLQLILVYIGFSLLIIFM